MITSTIKPGHKVRGRKPSKPPVGLAARLQAIRRQVGVSQETIGVQGFVSAPGWIKIENGQRCPSEKLLAAFVGWLVAEKLVRASAKAALIQELTTRKYAEHRAPFLAKLAQEHLADLPPTTV